LLVEPQRTNLLTYSSSFDNSAWVKQSSTITANNTTAPDGTLTADKIIETAVNDAHLTVQSKSISASVITASVFLKKSELQYAVVFISNTVNKNFAVLFDVNQGTVVTNFTSIPSYAAPTSSSIEDMGNGWYRCTITATDSFTNADLVIALNKSGTDSGFSYVGDGTSGLFLWGAQLEAGSYPTSYIPTTSASVTRNADQLRKSNASALIGQTEGTLFCEMYTNPAGNESLAIWPRNSTAGLYGSYIYFGTISTAAPRIEVVQAGVGQLQIVGSPLPVGWHKFAFAYKNNDFAFYVDGVQIGTANSGSVPVGMDEIYLDQYIDGGVRNANKKSVALWKTRLTNDQLAQLTTI
jgi:hypothetical protein